MRLFLAIDFDNVTKQRILTVQQRLHEAAQEDFSRLESLHLTLASLGEAPAQKVTAICKVMDRTRAVSLNLTFD